MATATSTEADTRKTLVVELHDLVERARGVVSRHPVVAFVAVGALGAYFLWPVAAAAVAMMKARVVGVISRATCLAKKFYFKLLHRQHSSVAAAGMANATEAETDEALILNLDSLVEQAKCVTSGQPVAAGAGAAALVVVGAYLLWHVAAAPTVAMMKAPGAAGFVISRVAFLANTKQYFFLLRTAGAAAAAAVFAV